MTAPGKWARLAEAARAVEDLDTVHGRKCAFKWDVTALCDCRKGELWRALAALTPAEVALADGAAYWRTGQKIAVAAFNHVSGVASEVLVLIDAGISVDTLQEGDTVAKLRTALRAAGRGSE